jgi:hypothetical protein
MIKIVALVLLGATAGAPYTLTASKKQQSSISPSNAQGVPVICHTDDCVANEKRMKALEEYLKGIPHQSPSDRIQAGSADIDNDTAAKILTQFFVFLAQQENTSPTGPEDFERITKDFLTWRAAQNK